MSRAVVAMLACLVCGAGGMWLASNFKLKLEPVAQPEATHPATVAEKPVAVAEPEKLPAHIVSRAPGHTGDVRQAGGIQAIPLLLAPEVLGQGAGKPIQILSITETIDNAEAKWDTTSANKILIASTTTVDVELANAPADPATLGIYLDGVQKAIPATAFTFTPGSTTANAKLTLKFADKTWPTQFTLGFATGTIPQQGAVVTFPKTADNTITIVRPGAPATGRLLLSGYQDTPYIPEPLEVTANSVSVVNGYIRVMGQSQVNSGSVDFFTFLTDPAGRFVQPVPTAALKTLSSTTGEWEYELNLGRLPSNTTGYVLCRTSFSGNHFYTTKLIPVKWVVKNTATKPVLNVESNLTGLVAAGKYKKDEKASTSEIPVYRANQSTFTLTVAQPGDGQVLLLYVGDQAVPAQAKRITGSAIPVPFNAFTVPGSGDHMVSVAGVNGNGEPGPRAKFLLKVRTAGPRAVSVNSPGFGTGAGRKETLNLQFQGEELDLDSVTVATNYSLEHNEGSPKAKNVVGIILPSSGNSVRITYGEIVPGTYTFTVKQKSGASGSETGVRDVFGNFLVGPSGSTAEDAVFPLTAIQTELEQPAQSAGVTPTGKNAVFPVNTEFHPLKDGFNPSDRVETRVVRLYYYRDAHRVAQIVNRDVRSFNGPAVDVRRRAAEKVRGEADNLQDERQSRERMAIRAAVATRAAENEVRQLEAKLQQARTDQATSRIQLGQREQQLAIAQREFDRLAPASPDLVKIDPAVEQQREKILQTNDDIRRSQDAKNTLPTGDPRIADFTTRINQLTLLKEQQERALDVLTRNAAAATDRNLDTQRNQVKSLDAELAKLRQTQATAAATEQTIQSQIDTARSKVQGLRVEEIKLTEEALGKDNAERRKREEQFRREVAAALADPDSYVAGLPDSVDPVLQCSVSVIGEGLIQIRGPVKGLNIIRTMINQIDAPVGQVRVGVHTVQVNGERVEKMDQVIGSIQRYLDHSRFLTTQSAQMLRKAVTTVASRKAMEAEQTLGLGCTQADRDMKYLHCFFGKDFIDELKTLDSEFLKTGNKILSLHSMDSTSLSSALFLMSLAKNDIRQEILDEFKRQVEGKLPEAELNFYMAGLSCPAKCEAYTDRKFCVLAQNAKFESLFGFFNTEVSGNETLSPLQREFVRLAQIFKSRMVTEMELKQRVMERAILEDRVGNFQEEQKRAKAQEDVARAKLTDYQVKLQVAIVDASEAFSTLNSELDGFSEQLGDLNALLVDLEKGNIVSVTKNVQRTLAGVATQGVITAADVEKNTGMKDDIRKVLQCIARINFANTKLETTSDDVVRAFQILLSTDSNAQSKEVDLTKLKNDISTLSKVIQAQAIDARGDIAAILRELRKDRPNLESIISKYNDFYSGIDKKLRRAENATIFSLFSTKIDPAFVTLQKAYAASQASARSANLVRRSLDEKKLLDMLVDEMEDKYIELLDGTRAHTANVDNYLKALSTALDDDFMTQFYNPAFRKVRSLGASWDVQLGQVESTSVLTNNRSFGKVSPTASMEFDLPRRDILMKEAFKSAKAAVQDYGALLNDPVFLSMVKMYGGAPMGAQFAGGLPAVRNVLPGLPSSSDEMIMGQAGSNRKEFGTNVESLIADPAIYKIETGTGYEIRPVISPDGQAVVFGFDYMYTTDVREPVRADEKHLGRVKRHFVRTDVQLSNFEMREVSKYWVSAKIARTSKGVSLLQDIPVAGALFRPAPSASSSLQQNIIYSQAAIFPTLFDLMGLRYAPAIADVTPENLINDEFVVRGRRDYLRAFIFDYGASRVDDALRIMYGERRADLYRSQYTIPHEHPNGYRGPGLRQRDSELQEGYDPVDSFPPSKNIPGMHLPTRQDRNPIPQGVIIPGHPEPLNTKPWVIEQTRPGYPTPTQKPSLPGEKLNMPTPVPSGSPSVIPPAKLPMPTPVPNQPIRSGPVPLPPNQYFPK